MKKYNGIITGYKKVGKSIVYAVLLFKYRPQEQPNDQWKFKVKAIRELDLMKLIASGKLVLMNVDLKEGKLVGTTGSLERFVKDKHRPIVIISEIRLENGHIAGYKVANFSGNVKNIRASKLLDYCKEMNIKGLIPIQNAMYIPESKDAKAHIRGFVENQFIQEKIVRSRSKHAVQPKIDEDKSNKALTRLREIFDDDQIRELTLGKKNGVDIKVYANRDLSADKMRVIREALQEGLNGKLLADPRYTLDKMELLKDFMKIGVDISYFASPEYETSQLTELAVGYLAGVDISKYANPDISPNEMAEARIRLEMGVWNKYSVHVDDSWREIKDNDDGYTEVDI